jgi:hypothetical protein
MNSAPSIRRQLVLIAVVAIAPALVLAMEPSYVHASVLDPSVPAGSSYYLEGIGFFSPWLITEVPARMKDVSLMDRLFMGQLLRFYIVSLILVALPWTVLRLAARAHAFLRAPSNTR